MELMLRILTDQPMNSQEPKIDEVEWSLWMCLGCRCELCATELAWEQFDELLANDPINWSKRVAPLAKAAGWTSPEEGALLCPNCSASII